MKHTSSRVPIPSTEMTAAILDSVHQVLKRYGEDRHFPNEGDIDIESVIAASDNLLLRLDEVDELRDATDEERIGEFGDMRSWLSERATKYLDQREITDALRPTELILGRILTDAGVHADAVAHHLVGANLQIRLAASGVQVENHGYTPAEERSSKAGNFLVNDTVFHVTMSAIQHVVEKCASSMTLGYRCYVLVPTVHVDTARGLATILGIADDISVVAIEQFVGQNIDEMGGFSRGQLGTTVRLLLETYNTRVQAVETDPSLLIEIPENLN